MPRDEAPHGLESWGRMIEEVPELSLFHLDNDLGESISCINAMRDLYFDEWPAPPSQESGIVREDDFKRQVERGTAQRTPGSLFGRPELSGK